MRQEPEQALTISHNLALKPTKHTHMEIHTHDGDGLSSHALLALRIQSLIADKGMIIASANRDLTCYGEWRINYNAWHEQADAEIHSLFSQANDERTHGDVGQSNQPEMSTPLDGASYSAFQWPYSPHVNIGDTIADAGCLNERKWMEMKGLAQPPCPHRVVVAVFPWGLRVSNGTEESDVVDWFLPNDECIHGDVGQSNQP